MPLFNPPVNVQASGSAVGSVDTINLVSPLSGSVSSGILTLTTTGSAVPRDTIRFVLNGKPKIVSGSDGAWIAPASGSFASVKLYRRSSGSNLSTTIDLNKNGTTMYTNQAVRPSITASAGNNVVTGSLPAIIDFTTNDRIEWDIDAVESGNPQDLCLILIAQYIA